MVAQGYIGRNPGDSSVVISRQSFTASGITTDFTFASGYTVGYFDLYINGVRLIEGTDYTASDSATFTVLNGGAQNGDVLEGVAYKAFNLGDTYTSKVGIQSAGILIGNAETLNFVGTGNTFSVNGTTIDVSISAGAGGTWATYDSSTGITTTKKVKIGNSLEVTGVSTFTGIATFAGNIDANGGITATTGTFEDLAGAGAIVFSTGDGVLDDSGNLSWTSGTNTLNATNIDSDGHTELDQLNVSGITTLGITSVSQLNVSGVSTLGVTTATNVTLQQLNVSGVSTLGVTTATNVTLQQLNVSGVSTFTESRFKTVAEEVKVGTGDSVTIDYDGDGNIGIITAPTGPISLYVNNIPTTNFSNKLLSYTVTVIQGTTGYACSSVYFNGIEKTLSWPSGFVSAGSTSSIDYYNFVGIDTGSNGNISDYIITANLNGNYTLY